MRHFWISTVVLTINIVFGVGCEKYILPIDELNGNLLPVECLKADYYVATNGNDNNPGTMDQPWATWQKACNEAQAGDTILIRGGVYRPSDGTGVFVQNKSGTSGKNICIWAFPGETPILDISNYSGGGETHGLYLYHCDYWHLKGLHITGAKQNVGYSPIGLRTESCNFIILEKIVSYNNQGNGIKMTASDNCLLLNCDAYNNDDPFGHNNGNGITLAYCSPSSTNIIRGCRAWNNKWGEGFGCWDVEGIVTFDSCWSFNNMGGSGDGAGFELGRTQNNPLQVTQRIIRNCIAVKNSIGFNQASANVKMEIYNNVAYLNDLGYHLVQNDNVKIIRNNLSYKNIYSHNVGVKDISDHNSWDKGISLTDADFQSLNIEELTQERKPDGSLPEIIFLRPAPGSSLIDAGIDVGLAYSGAAPDLGAFEN